MKKLINKPEDFVRESLEGMAAAHSDLIKLNYDPVFVYRADASIQGKVAIISGGGSGHEPMHAGFVGKGMLDAACPGEVFTSPTPDQMLEAAKRVDAGSGILYIVKNYSGDVMNFEMATELARGEGIRVLNILIDDDVAVKDSLYTQGRRGVGTTILAEKICGAAADLGYDLPQIANLCRRVNLNGRSMGIALTSCTVPANGTPTFELSDREIELGIGIHGEPGIERTAIKSVDEITEILTRSLIEDTAYSRTLREWDEDKGEWVDVELINLPFAKGDRLLAFVNSMGGTPVSELYIVYRKLAQICEQQGLQIVRNLIGPYITSLEMQLQAGLDGVLQRGKAQLGDKTMVDVLSPAVATFGQAVREGKGTVEAMQQAVVAAQSGLEETIPMQAKKGRASYLGQRSIGHQDPGGTSAYLMLKSLLEVLESSGKF